MSVCSCGANSGEWHTISCPKVERGFAKLNEPEPEASGDLVVKPTHYTRWAIEPVTFIMRNGFEFWRGNIIKYVSRAGFKVYPGMDQVESEICDLEKVRRYAEMRINQLKGEVEL